MTGKFITVEGCEGSGKSTQLRLLSEYLVSQNVDFIMTREPGGSGISEQIREIILSAANSEMCDECEALLYAAARVQHLKEIIEPALKAGKLVVCDRYIDSSLAYQGYARGMGVEHILSLNEYAATHTLPDLTLFLDISPKEAFLRKHGADLNDRMEALGIEFHERVYEGYKALQAVTPRICAVECGGTKYETAEKIRTLLKDKGIIN